MQIHTRVQKEMVKRKHYPSSCGNSLATFASEILWQQGIKRRFCSWRNNKWMFIERTNKAVTKEKMSIWSHWKICFQNSISWRTFHYPIGTSIYLCISAFDRQNQWRCGDTYLNCSFLKETPLQDAAMEVPELYRKLLQMEQETELLRELNRALREENALLKDSLKKWDTGHHESQCPSQTLSIACFRYSSSLPALLQDAGCTES